MEDNLGAIKGFSSGVRRAELAQTHLGCAERPQRCELATAGPVIAMDWIDVQAI